MDARTAIAVLADREEAGVDIETGEAFRLAKAALRDAEEAHPQRQDGLDDQLRDLVALANLHGMYDAADEDTEEAGHRQAQVDQDRFAPLVTKLGGENIEGQIIVLLAV